MEQQLLRPLQPSARSLKRKSDSNLQKSVKYKRTLLNDPERDIRWECCNCFKIVDAGDDVCANCGLSRCQKCSVWLGDGCVDAVSLPPVTRGGLEPEEDSQETQAPQQQQQPPDHTPRTQRRVNFHPSTPVIEVQEKKPGIDFPAVDFEALIARLLPLTLQDTTRLASDGHHESHK